MDSTACTIVHIPHKLNDLMILLHSTVSSEKIVWNFCYVYPENIPVCSVAAGTKKYPSISLLPLHRTWADSGNSP